MASRLERFGSQNAVEWAKSAQRNGCWKDLWSIRVIRVVKRDWRLSRGQGLTGNRVAEEPASLEQEAFVDHWKVKPKDVEVALLCDGAEDIGWVK